MRKLLEALGVLIVLQGAGGIIDQLGARLWLGLFAIDRSGWFTGHEIFANAILATLGVVLIAAVSRTAGPRR
jgi:hypothetical protein